MSIEPVGEYRGYWIGIYVAGADARFGWIRAWCKGADPHLGVLFHLKAGPETVKWWQIWKWIGSPHEWGYLSPLDALGEVRRRIDEHLAQQKRHAEQQAATIEELKSAAQAWAGTDAA